LEILLSQKIDDYSYVCRIEGITFDDVDNIIIGNRNIRKYNTDIITDLSDVTDIIGEAINKEYKGRLIVVGSEKGSSSVSKEKFFHHAEQSLCVLRLFSCALYGQAIHRTNIRLVNNCAHAFGPASCFGWLEATRSISFTRYLRSDQDFEINKELLDYLTEECFFAELSSLIDKQNRTELEDSVVKSIFWLGEAQKDSSHASAWVKLWSCIECFFTLDNDEITEKNARGISSILIFGGYLYDKYSDYDKIKKKIKNFYKLRSKIVHRAEYTNIDAILLEELSFIVAWVIIAMVSLVERGYTNLCQIQEQAERLDKISAKSNHANSAGAKKQRG